MGIKSVVRLPRRWLDAAGVAMVTALALAGAYVEANPVGLGNTIWMVTCVFPWQRGAVKAAM
jgi:hypothetical protein